MITSAVRRVVVSTASLGVTNTDGLLWALRRQAAPLTSQSQAPVYLSLQLNGRTAAELADGRLVELQALLAKYRLRVAGIEGELHGEPTRRWIKESLFLPDWEDAERFVYTQTLMALLAQLLPKGEEGYVTTIPLSFRGFVFRAGGDVYAYKLALLAAHSIRLEKWSGRRVTLSLRPRLRGVLDSPNEFRDFFGGGLKEKAVPIVADELGISRVQAGQVLRDRVRPALDIGHVLSRYESLDRWQRVVEETASQWGSIHVSNTVRTPLPSDPVVRRILCSALANLAGAPYYSMVMEKTPDGRIVCLGDLRDAIGGITNTNGVEWRVAYALPFSVTHLDVLGATLREAAALLRAAADGTEPVVVDVGEPERLTEAYRRTSGDAFGEALKWAHDVTADDRRRVA